ncbi:MAG: NAD-dependent epimerase/dehydratase family protein [Acidobacteriota bacterium]
MRVMVTGAAGFIGMHVADALLRRGDEVIGVDNFTPYYSEKLKRDRLALLEGREGFSFTELDVADHDRLRAMDLDGVTGIIHLAAQPGVRYSLDHPFEYAHANLTAHLSMMELARHHEGVEHFVYASSSSVYGGNTKMPFSVDDPVEHPVSLYAATKRCDELMSQCYSHLYGIRQTGLRFFTVYGPWYRPDMALFKFADAIMADRPIRVFNHGDMRRDFTWVGDIVTGVIAALDTPPSDENGAPHRVYNLGNCRSEPLLKVIDLLEQALGKKAERQLEGMQPGDVKETFADIEATKRDLGFEPTTPIEEGIPRFVAWYMEYHGH